MPFVGFFFRVSHQFIPFVTFTWIEIARIFDLNTVCLLKALENIWLNSPKYHWGSGFDNWEVFLWFQSLLLIFFCLFLEQFWIIFFVFVFHLINLSWGLLFCYYFHCHFEKIKFNGNSQSIIEVVLFETWNAWNLRNRDMMHNSVWHWCIDCVLSRVFLASKLSKLNF